jgi:hypothetical protein
MPSQPPLTAVDDDDDEFFSSDDDAVVLAPAQRPTTEAAAVATEPVVPTRSTVAQPQKNAQQPPSPKTQSPTRTQPEPPMSSPPPAAKGERPPMDFTVDPMDDILDREDAARRQYRPTPRRMTPQSTNTLLQRLSQPKRKTPRKGAVPQQRDGEDDDDAWDDAVDIGAEDRRQSPPRTVQSKVASPRRPPSAAEPFSPAAAPPAVMRITTADNADRFFVVVTCAGRRAGASMDRKTLIATTLEALRFPPSGCLLYRGLPVHAHATCVTLGLRPGKAHASHLSYVSDVEASEETARARVVADQVAAWGSTVLSLAAVLGARGQRVPLRHFVDAEDDFVDATASP